jgi:PAS domain S-box-containing protein
MGQDGTILALRALSAGADDTESSQLARMIRIAAELADVAAALVYLIDRDSRSVVSSFGLSQAQPPIEGWPCRQAQDTAPVTLVDVAADAEFSRELTGLLGTPVEFFAELPLKMESGAVVGGLCLLDSRRRRLTPALTELLGDVGELIVAELLRERAAGQAAGRAHGAPRGQNAGLGNAQLGQILEGSLNELFVFDVEHWRFLEVNLGGRENLGYTRAELRKMDVLDIKPDYDAASFSRLLQPLLDRTARQVRFNCDHRRKDGSRYPVQVRVELNSAGEQPVFVGFVEDVSEKQAREAALKEALEFREAILNASLDGIVTFRSMRREDGAIGDFRLIEVNESGCELTGLSREELIGSTLLTEFPSTLKSGAFEKYCEVAETGEPVRFQLPFQDKDGEQKWFRISAAKNLDGITVTFSDITELRAQQADLYRTNESLRQFAYVASHDLQEPLRKIMTFGSMLSLAVEEGAEDDVGLCVEVINDAARRARQLVSDLLAYSRASNWELRVAPVVLNDAIAEALEQVSQQLADVGAHIEPPATQVRIAADRAQLVQLLTNFLTNAVKYRHPGRGCEIAVRLHFDPQRGSARLCVVDNGIGFEEEYATKIFEPFRRLHSRAQYPGSGIGLAICATVAERHGWKIGAESKPDQGSVFWIQLPAELADEGPADDTTG